MIVDAPKRNRQKKESADERRRAARHPVEEPTQVTPWEGGGANPIYGSIMDVSGSGLRLRSEYCFVRGEVMRIRLAGITFRAVARYCKPVDETHTDTGFQILEAIQDALPDRETK